MKIAVVLQKPASISKTRLKDDISFEERIKLVYVMLCDVLHQLSQVNSLDYFGIFTKDPLAINMTRKLGGKVFYEEVNEGMNKAVFDIQKRVVKEVKHMLVLPGDIPLVSATELDTIINKHIVQKRMATIIPCRREIGTNGLLLSPPNIMPTYFGIGSMNKHRNIAHERNLNYEVYPSQSIAYDIDTKEDLLILDDIGAGTLTKQYIKEAKILNKLKYVR